MARILAVFAAILSIVLMAGCQSSYLNQPTSPLQVVTEAKLTPNISVGEKIQATATVHKVLFFFSWGPGKFAEGVNYGNNLPITPVSSSVFGDTLNEAKAAAAYKACTDNKADFIICPRYFIITDNYFFYKRTKAKVFGYKGVLSGVEKTVPQGKTVQSVVLTKPVQLAEPIQIAQPIKIEQPVKVVLPKSKSVTPTAQPDASTK